jgi:quercetin dioxygenase-like cupin family protein
VSGAGADSGTFVDPSAPGGSLSSSPAEAWFINVRPVEKRSTPPFSPATTKYASEDLPSLPRLNQSEALQLVNLAKGGHSALRKPSGVETVIALSGNIEVNAGTLPGPRALQPGQAVTLLQGTPIQVVNRGTGEAKYLAFFLLPSGSPLEVEAT